jgi:hypothetical protein
MNLSLNHPVVKSPLHSQIHRLILLYPISSEDWAGFLITIKASDARLPKSRGMRRTRWYAAVTRDEGNAADDVLMVDQGHSQEEETPEKGKNIDQNGHSPSFYS